MDLAYGFIAQALKTHDDLMVARMQERRRMVADQRAEAGASVDVRVGFLRRLSKRWHGRGVRRDARAGHGLRAAH